MIKKFTPIILVLLLISFRTVSASGEWWWEDYFIKERQNVYSSSHQFLVMSAPYLGSKIIKVVHAGIIPAVGYVDNDGTRFYMSKWSYKQFQKGKRPNWFVPQ